MKTEITHRKLDDKFVLWGNTALHDFIEEVDQKAGVLPIWVQPRWIMLEVAGNKADAETAKQKYQSQQYDSSKQFPSRA